MKLFTGIQALNRRLAAGLQVLLVIVFSLLVLDVIWGVFSRYVLQDQASWSEELARLLMVWLALLATALVSREDRHLSLDFLVRAWPEDLQRVSHLLVYVFVFCFAAIVMTWGGWELVADRFASGQSLPALGIAKGWFYLALPVSGMLICLFIVELFWKVCTSSFAESETETEPIS
ncbi:MAG: TRAP transporter small permease [Verrucomicrobiota bacterium]